MTSRVRRTPLAASDIHEIAEYLRCEAGLEMAMRFVDNTGKAFQTLADTPFAGALLDLPDLREPTIRRWHIDRLPNHVILYRPSGEVIEIIRVLHGARDLGSLFADSNGCVSSE